MWPRTNLFIMLALQIVWLMKQVNMDSLTAHQTNGLPKLHHIPKDAKLSPMVSIILTQQAYLVHALATLTVQVAAVAHVAALTLITLVVMRYLLLIVVLVTTMTFPID